MGDLQRHIVDALVASRLAGSAGDMTSPLQAHEVAEVVARAVADFVEVERDRLRQALDALRDAHHIPYVDEDHQGGNCADVVVGLLSRATRAERDLARVEASRRDWAAEAMRLQYFIEERMFPGVFRAADPPIIPIVCACISDGQAAALGPGFSRPVCAVHPKGSLVDVMGASHKRVKNLVAQAEGAA